MSITYRGCQSPDAVVSRGDGAFDEYAVCIWCGEAWEQHSQVGDYCPDFGVDEWGERRSFQARESDDGRD